MMSPKTFSVFLAVAKNSVLLSQFFLPLSSTSKPRHLVLCFLIHHSKVHTLLNSLEIHLKKPRIFVNKITHLFCQFYVLSFFGLLGESVAAHFVSDLISTYSSANILLSCQNTASNYTSSDLFNLDKCYKGFLSFPTPDR